MTFLFSHGHKWGVEGRGRALRKGERGGEGWGEGRKLWVEERENICYYSGEYCLFMTF